MTKKERQFTLVVKAHYKRQGRRSLPWRLTRDPYKIWVSEIMLQQTQADRVIVKYEMFLGRFDTIEALANASLGDVLRAWQGLGYNRRAKLLHACAQKIVREHGGVFPQTYDALKTLPGIGPYTAGAVMAFAFQQPVPIIETNIRTVYLHHFFANKTDVHDIQVMRMVERTLDHENPGDWYAALMDYGSVLKRTVGNASRRSAHYSKQGSFAGSNRQIRGHIVRALSTGAQTLKKLSSSMEFPIEHIEVQLEKLVSEGLVIRKNRSYSLPS